MAFQLALTPTTFGTVLLLIIVTNFLRRSTPSQGHKPIPGPLGWSIVGNTFQIGKIPQQMLRKLYKEYGEIYQLKLFALNWVFLNTPEAVKMVFDKESAKTSDRVPLPVASEEICRGLRLVLMKSGTITP
ncbi:hypothetical protein F5883DRAFT_675611 [Diaporthe sp. PMI_573]|nr:hypothetical protein F5883DRAFT_675611 [Diaporthaceae sp. PMI_573]